MIVLNIESKKYMKIHSSVCIALLACVLSCNSPEATQNLYTDFEELKTGKLTDSETKKIWPGAHLECGKKDFIFYKLGITPHPHYIVKENGNNCLKVLLPEQHYGPLTGAQWKIALIPRDEYFFSYQVKFEKEFDFVLGGKLPGLAGGAVSAGQVPNGYDGLSARMMYWQDGKVSFYVYFPMQSTKWGERLYLKDLQKDTLKLSRGIWHELTQYLKLNTPGKNNGILQAWVDGKEAFYSDTLLFRKDKNLKIDRLSYSVFMGGGDLSWAPARDQYIYFDDFRVSTIKINP